MREGNNQAVHATQSDSDPRPTDALLSLVLAKDADHDDEGYWQIIVVLQHRLPGMLGRICKLSTSGDEKIRDTAAAILGQGRINAKFAADICAETLLRMLTHEQSTAVLTSAIFALGHLHDPRAVSPMVSLSTHRDASVRYAVVSSLGGCEDEQAIAVLIERSTDEDGDVRNWATFGIGSLIDNDTPEIRAALFARLEERDDEIRGEAFVGLARRGDIRVASALMKELESNAPSVLCDRPLFWDAIEAVVNQAGDSGSKEWLPILTNLTAHGVGD